MLESASIILLVDIRAISAAMGLRTIVWSYDTFDWEEGTGNVTAADVNANYQAVIDSANNGTFNSVRPTTIWINAKFYSLTVRRRREPSC
jgi:hypothetical protein